MRQTFFKHDMETRAESKAKRTKAKEANWLAVCKQVDARDRGRCRACYRQCDTKAIDPQERAHRHHVEFRSKGGQDVASNLVLLCATCHDRVHVKRTLRIEPTTAHGADGPLTIWRTVEDNEHDWHEYISRRETAVHQVERD